MNNSPKDLFNDATEKCQELLSNENIYPSEMVKKLANLIRQYPKEMHNSLQLKFIYLYGHSLGLTSQEIRKMIVFR